MATLSDEQQARFNRIARPYLSHPEVQRMKGFVQHGSVSTYAHCVSVARTSFLWAQKLPVHVDEHDLVASALLHDFYLYDWHDRATSKPHHATKHPLYAAENAVRVFNVSEKQRRIIQSHMWPLPPDRVPDCAEAWIICAADKWCSLHETLFQRRPRHSGRANRHVETPARGASVAEDGMPTRSAKGPAR